MAISLDCALTLKVDHDTIIAISLNLPERNESSTKVGKDANWELQFLIAILFL